MSEKNVPEVRFRGFSGEWDKKNLEAQVDFYSGLTYSPQNIVDDGGTLVLRSSNVKNGEVVDADNVYVDSSAVNCQNVRLGDIIVVVRNGSRALIGKHGQIKAEMQDTVIGAFMTGVQSKQPDFINALLDTVHFSKEIEKNLGATINQITTGSFKKMSFFFTEDTDEQAKIGEFFKNLDDLIAQNQKKYDKLLNMKKACLDKMFPKDGADTPEVRFNGFGGEWEKTEIGEIAKDTFGGGTPSTSVANYWNGNIPWIQSSDLTEHNVKNATIRKTITKLALANSAVKLVPQCSIAIVTRVGVGKVALINRQYSTSQDFISLSNISIDTFFATYSIYRKLQNVLHEVQGTSIKGITKDELLNKKIYIPLCEAEQTKIGDFFQTLDNLIALRKTELEKLKNIKKACLDKMFI